MDKDLKCVKEKDLEEAKLIVLYQMLLDGDFDGREEFID